MLRLLRLVVVVGLVLSCGLYSTFAAPAEFFIDFVEHWDAGKYVGMWVPSGDFAVTLGIDQDGRVTFDCGGGNSLEMRGPGSITLPFTLTSDSSCIVWNKDVSAEITFKIYPVIEAPAPVEVDPPAVFTFCQMPNTLALTDGGAWGEMYDAPNVEPKGGQLTAFYANDQGWLGKSHEVRDASGTLLGLIDMAEDGTCTATAAA